ncbi:MAG: Energy transducer TonB [Ignavibacteria bacterium]|nr:Energy transducer TonB [Ignavibacteria bacterium]
MKKNNLLFCIIFLFVLSCGVERVSVIKRTYVDYKKKSIDTSIVISIPQVQLSSQTKQMQKKGDVTVSCEIVQFDIERSEYQTRNITFADPNIPNYDQYEVMKIPVYNIKPLEFQFKIRIRNNQDRVIKLYEVPIILIVDGIQTSIPSELLTEWKTGLIIKGFEKEYLIPGPKLNLQNIPKQLYIAVHDVPIQYDKAGNVLRKDNFEWTFQTKEKEIKQPDKFVFTYVQEAINRQQCQACSGLGKFVSKQQCYLCEGRGVLTNKEGKKYRCINCGGTGEVNVENMCYTCSGKGLIEYPLSPRPPVLKAETWSGWTVLINTNPLGAKISLMDPKTENYKEIGFSSKFVNWLTFESKEYPIIVEYQGKIVKVLPYNINGEESSKIMIDFLKGSEPLILIGRKVE